MADLNLGEVVATTLRNRQPGLKDNLTNNNAFLYRVEHKGGFTETSGGRTIVEPLMYAANSNAAFYNGYDSFLVSPDDSIDAAEFDWKQWGGFALISGLDGDIKQSGKHAQIKWLEARIKVLLATQRNLVAASLFSDGTGSGGKELGGLDLICDLDPTSAGTVGGIDQAANAFWRNQINDLSGGGTTTTSANILGYMNDMCLATQRETDQIDLIVAGQFMYKTFWEALQPLQRYATSKMADAGFQSLQHVGSDVVYDANANTQDMFFLNTDFLHFRIHPARNFKVGDAREVTNADYQVVPVWGAGNLTCSNRSLQGRLRGENT